MSLGISNPTSAAIIRRALDSEGQMLSTTPYRFDPASDGGLAILGESYEMRMWKSADWLWIGSPNGARFAHFLIQRKNNVGLKTVIGIFVFECLSRSRAPCLMFKLGSLAAPVLVPQGQADSPDQIVQGSGGMGEKRVVDHRNFVRIHTFHYVGNGSVSREDV
jgi:hypothetical protein